MSTRVTGRQITKLIYLINRIGKSTYRVHKTALGLDVKSITDLSKQEAWRLIDRIISQQKGSQR